MNALREILQAARYQQFRALFTFPLADYTRHPDPDSAARNRLSVRLGEGLLASGDARVSKNFDVQQGAYVYAAEMFTLRRGDLERIIQAAFDAGLRYQEQAESQRAEVLLTPQPDGVPGHMRVSPPLRFRATPTFVP